MSSLIFESNRYFTLYEFQVSHGQMLLRSDKRKGYAKNIDIIFFDTRFVQVFTMLEGVKISIIDNHSIPYHSVAKFLTHQTNNLFEIESVSEKYYVAAAFVKVYENNLEFSETSLGVGLVGREIELASSK